MSAPLDDLTVQVTDLIDRPGASRPVDLALPVPGGFVLPLAEVAAPVRLAGVIESVVDGLLVRGTVEAEVTLSCARCLADIDGDATVDVVELFSDPATIDPDAEQDEGYALGDGTLHLDALLRDALATAIPLRALCTAGCAGICPGCGADRNETVCVCVEDSRDPRWAALGDLLSSD